MDRTRAGLAGLLAFEAIIFAYLLGSGAPVLSAFPLMYGVGALALAIALWRGPARWHYVVLAVASAYRAYLQTADGAALGVWPTWLVPAGFAWLALAPAMMPRLAIATVGVARTWFIVWYFMLGNELVAAANVLGAAGAWLWAAAEEPAAGAEGSPATAWWKS